MKLFSCKSEAGFSLLEQALVLPIALTFIVGVLDVNSLFQANTAMHDGVTEALRCLTPTDGACTIDASNADVLYEVKRSAAQMHWEVPQYSYSANLGYYSAPTLANAEVTLQSAKLPKVNTGRTHHDALHPEFRNGGTEISVKNVSNLKASITDNSKYALIGIKKVGTLPMKPAGKCFVAKEVSGEFLPTEEECNSKKVRFMLHITGEVKADNISTDPKAEANALLYYHTGNKRPEDPEDLSKIDSTVWEDLGGRAFSGGADGSFYTRGAQEVSNKQDIVEYDIHSDLKGNPGDNVYILLVLRRDKGTKVAWSANSIKMYTEEFQQKQFCNLKCNDVAVNGECKVTYPNSDIELDGHDAAEPSVLSACEQIGKACNTKIKTKNAPEGTVVADNKLFITSNDYKADSTVSCLYSNSLNYADKIPEDSQESSMLFGRHDPSCNWEDDIRNEIANIKNSVNKDYVKYAPFANITRREVGVKEFKDRPNLACAEAKQKATAVGPQEILGTYRWEEIPAECFNSTAWVCDISSPSFVGTPSNLSHDTDLAVTRAENAIYNSLPWSKANCEGKGCSVVTARADGNDFTVTAQVTVPLRLFSMLGLTEHNPVIKRTESAVWEGAFAR